MSSSMPCSIMIAAAFSMAAFAVDKALPAVVPTKSTDTVAGGSLVDPLHACLARIPKSATPRQKMLAEQACRRAEADRAPVQLVNGIHVATNAVGI